MNKLRIVKKDPFYVHNQVISFLWKFCLCSWRIKNLSRLIWKIRRDYRVFDSTKAILRKDTERFYSLLYHSSVFYIFLSHYFFFCIYQLTV
jgi:hypothetical protein